MENCNPKVDAFIGRAKSWRAEFEKLRALALDCGLTEELKWGKPCYALNGGNVAIIIGFKEYCALLFFKGVLLQDPEGILVAPGENSQSARQMRFTSLEQIQAMEAVILAYLEGAIEIEKSGLEVTLKKVTEYDVPEEFQSQLDADPTLKKAFECLTPGRQRFYLMHFAQPKQAKTRESRVEKCIPLILEGKGLND